MSAMDIIEQLQDEVDTIRQQLATTERLLAESQARVYQQHIALCEAKETLQAYFEFEMDGTEIMDRFNLALNMPSDSTTLDAALKAAYEQGRQQMQLSCDMERDAAIAKAKREENEACEGICNRFAGREMHPAECAAAIRMRRMADELKGGEQG